MVQWSFLVDVDGSVAGNVVTVEPVLTNEFDPCDAFDEETDQYMFKVIQ